MLGRLALVAALALVVLGGTTGLSAEPATPCPPHDESKPPHAVPPEVPPADPPPCPPPPFEERGSVSVTVEGEAAAG